jgi:undecaprenyl-diphosphatase
MPRRSANAARKPISKGDGTRLVARMRSAGRWPWSRAVYLGRREIGTLATLLLFAALTLTFGIVANEMSAGNTRAFDNAVVMALRSDANPSDPLGPMWFEGAVRDITSLGSNAVLIILTLGTVGFLALSGARGAALHVLVSVGTGAILIQVLKELFGRVRPDVVPQAVSEVTRSFPSGHATLAAVTYLTLGALVARVQSKPALKMYVLFVAILLTLLVGVSRIYLGVHWPTDVLAGWCLGSAWAIACWLVAVQLQRKGQIEKRIGA